MSSNPVSIPDGDRRNTRPRCWFVHADQLNGDRFPGHVKPADVSLVFCESAADMRRLPFHRKKIVYTWSAQRHFAAACRDQGYHIVYLKDDAPVADQLSAWLEQGGQEITLDYMEPAEWELRGALGELDRRFAGRMKRYPNTFFLSDPEEWKARIRDGYRMEYFYREMRKRSGYLMQDGKPQGGAWNYDRENRRKLPRGRKPPRPLRFDPDDVTRAVIEEVERLFDSNWGETGGFSYAVDRSGALQAADDFFRHRLREFGPFEDAMAAGEYTLYHSKLSIYMNNGLLGPQELCERAIEELGNGHAPLNSVEGYIRQIIGWREYIRNYYEAMMPAVRDANSFGFTNALPRSFWSAESRMNCVRECVKPVLETGYSHHIARLMVLSNYSNLTETDPRELLGWFHYGYLDAWEWVVLPNVLGMSTFADGGVLASKPYVASGNYINKMSDYCADCAYSVSQKTGPEACPFNYLYWNFVDRHQDAFEESGRVSFMLNTLRRKTGRELAEIRRSSRRYLDSLERYQ